MSDDVARGVHAHPDLKLGRRPPSGRPALLLGDVLTGALPPVPVSADHIGKLSFGLYENDRFGDCGPTSVANLVRLVSAGLTGTEVQPSQEDVFDLYRRSGNPSFDPATDADDNGVDMQTMLTALLAGGIGDGKGGKVIPIAFAKVDVTNDGQLAAAVSIFGGALWGVNLMTAQQGQTANRLWTYAQSSEWGGHAVLNGAYEVGSLADVITWAERVVTADTFRRHQLEEAWVVVWPWNLEHPAFQQGVDLTALEAAYKALTGRDLPVPAPTPSPPPSPAPAPPQKDADVALWAAVAEWSGERHAGDNKAAASAVRTWAKEKGLLK